MENPYCQYQITGQGRGKEEETTMRTSQRDRQRNLDLKETIT